MSSYKKKSLTSEKKDSKMGFEIEAKIKARQLSNLYYNEGLSRARIRDLSGAITMLKNSLRFYKANTNARNLLGLIYNEIGDTAKALLEWVISSNFKKEENEASNYLSYFQLNPTRLDGANQIIKKYNSAIKSLHSDSEDLAIIQLKKVVSLCPNHLKALQLLALLHLKNKKYAEVGKYLKSAKKIDICNPLTLKYLAELKDVSGSVEKTKEVKPERVLFADSDSFAPASFYKEDKPSVLPWINLVIGIILGAAFFAVAMLPGIKAKSVEGKVLEIVALNETLAETNASISQIEGEKEDLKRKVADLERKNNQLSGKEKTVKKEEKTYTKDLISAAMLFMSGDEKGSAESLVKVKKEAIKEEEALNLYNQLSGKVFAKQAKALHQEAKSWYEKGRFDKALPIFSEAFNMNPLDVETVYFIARSHDRLGEKEKAREWYQKILDSYSKTYRVNDAKYRLRLLGGE